MKYTHIFLILSLTFFNHPVFSAAETVAQAAAEAPSFLTRVSSTVTLDAMTKVFTMGKICYDAYNNTSQNRIPPTNTSLDGVIGSAESKNASTTVERIGELEQEGVLQVKSSIRVKDNFNRVAVQVKQLTVMKKEEEDAMKHMARELSKFKSCMESSIIHPIIHYDNKNKKYMEDDYIKITDIKPCVEALKTEAQKITEKTPIKENDLFKTPLPLANSEHTTELAGHYEWNVGLRATHSRIRELEVEKELDVKYGVRARDNLNRARNQVIGLQNDINKLIFRRNIEAQPVECIFDSWKRHLKNGNGYEGINTKFFDRCFEFK